MTDTWKKWTIWTSIYVFDYCVFSWRNHMWPHLDGYADEGMMKTLFWHYLNYGNTNTCLRSDNELNKIYCYK
jgi:hypothetical protein